MKIQLEHKHTFQFARLDCVACQHSYSSNSLRTLLCHDDGTIAGDICQNCLRQGTSRIQQQLKHRSIELFTQPISGDSSISAYQEALELAELAVQPLAIPPFYIWWWKQLTIVAAATQALETARREPISRRHRQPKPLKITFLAEEPVNNNN
jgi:hypothetical protein